MKILYLSCHSILEHDEVSLLNELKHEVFSLGSYINPNAPHDPKRPPINSPYNDQLGNVALQSSKENLHQELIDWADIIIIMSRPDWIINNWDKFTGKRIVWRTIGQSTPDIESQLQLLRQNGLQIVRMSLAEEGIQNYIGKDALIRFYKDPEEYKDWNGDTEKVISVAQSMKARGAFCGFNNFDEATKGLPRALYGPGNEDSGIEGGILTYNELKKVYQDNRVFFYTGTYPSPYTLGLMEAMMTGIPIVAIGKDLWDIKLWNMDIYEVDKIIQSGVNGYVSNDINELRGYVELLLKDKALAKKIGDAGRETAIELFGKSKIKEEWRKFLD